jgi:hypothetical protein
MALVAFAYRGLRQTGFRFRWESGMDGGVRSGSPLRVSHRVGTVGSDQTVETAAGPSSVGDPPTTTTVLEPPSVTDERDLEPGAGRTVEIDFETFGDRGTLCSPCAVSEEWVEQGLRVSFRSWTADSSQPSLLDGREYLPPGAARHVLGPAFRGDRGLEVGVIRLDFLGRPRTVSFSLYGPDIVPRFDVTAWSGDAILTTAVERAGGRIYDVMGRGLFREELITVRAATGIDRVSLDGWGPPGHMVLVDHLVITP